MLQRPAQEPESGAGQEIGSFSVGYLKGQARAQSLIALLMILLDEHINIEKAFPKLFKSIFEISCKAISLPSKTSEVFESMRRSHAGSIRRAPNCVTWVEALTRLQAVDATDPGTVIKAWNEDCARSDRLIGAKAQSVKQLLELPLKARQELISSVSFFGFEGSLLKCSLDGVFNFRLRQMCIKTHPFDLRLMPRGSHDVRRCTVSKRRCQLHCHFLLGFDIPLL